MADPTGQNGGFRALNKMALIGAIFIFLLYCKFAGADSQPDCYKLSLRNPNAVILCRGQQWYSGRILTSQRQSISSQASVAKVTIKQNPPSSWTLKKDLSAQQNTPSNSGVIAVSIFILVAIFVIALVQEKRREKENRTANRKDVPTKRPVALQISTSYLSSSKSAVSSDSVWVPQGKPVTVAGYTIQGGLLYVGTKLESVQAWGTEPALINPSLPVNKVLCDRDGIHMTYWPSYSQIDPASRNAYLQWLADGRRDPGISIGYVFLYFYGLERRAFIDTKNSPNAQNELQVILDEVKRLRSIYTNNSFQNYSGSFINALRSRITKGKLYEEPPSANDEGYELPFTLKKALAQLAADGKPLSAVWALTWIENDRESRLRTPAYRCKEEFQKLFHIRYSETFGEGLVLPQKGPKLRGIYRPASASFGGAVEWTEKGLWDVSAYRGPINQLSKIAEACVEELDPYSRYLGRSGSDPCPLAKLALSPTPLLKDCQDKELQALNLWLSKNVTSDKMFVTDIQNIVCHFPLLKPENFDKRDFVALCQLLGKMGVGIEPDVRFGSSLPEAGPVVLFKPPSDCANAPTLEYASATVILHLATAVAESDGKVSEKEEIHLEEQLGARFQLSSEERVRLRAHTQWLLASSPSFSGVKKRLESFNQIQRQTLGKFLVSVAQSDGYIDPSEVKMLNKIYGILDLDSKELYSHAHMAAIEPVKIEDAEAEGPSFAVPKPSRKKKTVNVELDMSKVEVKLAETAAVTAMLSNIFTEEKTQASIVEQVISEADGNLRHFESEHYGFIKELSQKLSWARQELEAIAAKSNLLLDGALDSINDAAFKAFDQPFFEGDDPIEINPNVLKELQ